MEAWTIINKATNLPVRFDRASIDDEFSTLWYFSTYENHPIWVVDSEEIAKNSIKKDVHAQYSISYKTPNTDNILVDNYIPIRISDI